MSPFSKEINRDILTVIATCSCADRDILNVTIHPNKTYFSRSLSELRTQDIVTYRNHEKKTLRFTKPGLEALKAYNPQAYDHYMTYSYGNHLPSDENFRQLNRRQTGVVACMLKAGFAVGPAKPTVEDIWDGTAAKMAPSRCTYYMAKETRYVLEQVRSRNHLSRASGLLFCHGMKALVYNALDQDMRLTRKTERMTMIGLSQLQQELYTEYDYDSPDYALLFMKDDAAALELLRKEPASVKGGKPSKRRKAVVSLSEAICDPDILGTHIMYIPTNQIGIITLKLLRTFTEEQLLDLLFSPEERAAAAAQRCGDAVIRGCTAFNCLLMDLTRLVWIREHMDLRNVGFICMEEQVDFLVKFFNSTSFRARTYSKKQMNLLLQGTNPYQNRR